MKTYDTKVSSYEITFITKEPFDAAQGRDNPVKKLIESLGGKITKTDSLGQKNFVYPIKKEKSGFYTTVDFEIEPEKVLELNKKISLQEEILRYLLITAKAASIAKPEVKIAKLKVEVPKIEAEAIVEKVEKPEAKIEEKIEEKPAKKTTRKPKAEKPKAEPVKKPAIEAHEENEEERLKALDKKLDELLKE